MIPELPIHDLSDLTDRTRIMNNVGQLSKVSASEFDPDYHLPLIEELVAYVDTRCPRTWFRGRQAGGHRINKFENGFTGKKTLVFSSADVGYFAHPSEFEVQYRRADRVPELLVVRQIDYTRDTGPEKWQLPRPTMLWKAPKIRK